MLVERLRLLVGVSRQGDTTMGRTVPPKHSPSSVIRRGWRGEGPGGRQQMGGGLAESGREWQRDDRGTAAPEPWEPWSQGRDRRRKSFRGSSGGREWLGALSEHAVSLSTIEREGIDREGSMHSSLGGESTARSQGEERYAGADLAWWSADSCSRTLCSYGNIFCSFSFSTRPSKLVRVNFQSG